MSSSNPISASLTIQTIRVQPPNAAAKAIAAILSPATTVKTQELSGVWCPLLMTLANNTFCANNKKKPFVFNGNSRVLFKPQIRYSIQNSSNNNCCSCCTTEPIINQQQTLKHYNPHCRCYCGYCCCCCCHCSFCRYRQITSGPCDKINPQATETITNTTNNYKVYCEMDTITTNINENFFACNLQNPLPSILLKAQQNSLPLLIISLESLPYIPLTTNSIDLESSIDTERSSKHFAITKEKNILVKVGADDKIYKKTSPCIRYNACSILKLEKINDNLSTTVFKRKLSHTHIWKQLIVLIKYDDALKLKKKKLHKSLMDFQ